MTPFTRLALAAALATSAIGQAAELRLSCVSSVDDEQHTLKARFKDTDHPPQKLLSLILNREHACTGKVNGVPSPSRAGFTEYFIDCGESGAFKFFEPKAAAWMVERRFHSEGFSLTMKLECDFPFDLH